MIGVVLAGGASRRMGTDKAAVEVGGRSMLDWVESALAAVCDRVVISGRPGGVADSPGMHGPLAGLAACLAWDEPLLVVAVDQPWVRVETLRALGAIPGTAVPVDGGVRQVTCARYAPDVAVEARRVRSIQKLLDAVPFRAIAEPEWSSWGEDGRSWYSADDGAALARGLERYGPPTTWRIADRG
jgi:molybdopterin-guanine dinucleotide biosynthesis protein A